MGKLVEVKFGRSGKRGRKDAAPPQVGGDYSDLDRELVALPCNDIGNSQRLRRRIEADPSRGLLFIRGVGWAGWDQRRWSIEDGEHHAIRAAQTTADAMRGEVHALAAMGAPTREVKDFLGFVVGSGFSARLSAMVDQAEPHLAVNARDVDQGRRLLNVENGTLELRDGSDFGIVLRPHAQADRLTRLVPVTYDAEARCPQWEAFLERIQPEVDMRRFLQRWFGYCLTADVSEECLCIFWGKGRNGKGVLTETMQMVFGDYSSTIGIASLMRDDRRRGSEASPDIAKLPGVRLVVTNEPEEGVQFSEGLVKTLTGGDIITARHLNKPFFQFLPQFKITISTNPKPRVRGLDDGIWRRLRLVPFETQIPEEETVAKDELLARFRAELPGILNWLLDGFQAWAVRGLDPPKIVLDATKQFREESNPLGRFLMECTIGAPTAQTQATELYEAFVRWCGMQGEKPWSQNAFSRKMTDMHYQRSKYGTVSYLGLSLDEEWRRKPKETGTPPPPEAGDPEPMPSI